MRIVSLLVRKHCRICSNFASNVKVYSFSASPLIYKKTEEDNAIHAAANYVAGRGCWAPVPANVLTIVRMWLGVYSISKSGRMGYHLGHDERAAGLSTE